MPLMLRRFDLDVSCVGADVLIADVVATSGNARRLAPSVVRTASLCQRSDMTGTFVDQQGLRSALPRALSSQRFVPAIFLLMLGHGEWALVATNFIHRVMNDTPLASGPPDAWCFDHLLASGCVLCALTFLSGRVIRYFILLARG